MDNVEKIHINGDGVHFNDAIKNFPFYAVYIDTNGNKKIEVFQKVSDAVIFLEEVEDARNYKTIEEIPSVQIVKINKKNPRLIYAGHTFFSKEAYNWHKKITRFDYR